MNIHTDSVDGQPVAVRISTTDGEGATILEIQIRPQLDGLAIVSSGELHVTRDARGYQQIATYPRVGRPPGPRYPGDWADRANADDLDSLEDAAR